MAWSIPADFINGPDASAAAVIDGGGEWMIIQENGQQRVLLNFSMINGASLGRNGFSAPLFIANGGDLSLFYYRDDPDSGAVTEFRRQRP
ncbi:MAG TPA: hypothetical protein VGG10_20685 [Rhizomicrobium sp.]